MMNQRFVRKLGACLWVFTFAVLSLPLWSQHVGVGTSAPLSKLDVNGDLALEEGVSCTVVNGANHNLSLSGNYSHYRLVGASAAFGITGIGGGNNGQLLVLINATSYPLTLYHLNAASAAANQLMTGLGSDAVIGSGAASTFIYNSSLSKWVMIGRTGEAGDHDIYEVGTTLPPDNINDLKYTLGKLSVGINNPYGQDFTVANTSGMTTLKIGYAGAYNNLESGKLIFDENVSVSSTEGDYCGFQFWHDGSTDKLLLQSFCGGSSTEVTTFTRIGRVGISNNNPLTNLDVAGGLALRQGANITVVAGNNNLGTLSATHYRLTGATGAFNLNSIADAHDGKLLTLINTTGYDMTLVQSGNIRTGTGANVTLRPQGSATLIYNTTLAGWQVIALSGEPSNNLIAYGQTTTLFNLPNITLKTINVTTTATDRVILVGEFDYSKLSTTSYLALGLFRNGAEIHEIAAYSPVNADNSLQIHWVDTPGAGTHTYTLRYYVPTGSTYIYGSILEAFLVR